MFLIINYKNNYYSVGFDFGKGTLGGYIFNKDEGTRWKMYQLNEPFSKTYAKTLIQAKDDIYFIDMYKALNSNAKDFFNTKNMQLVNGASGYNPKNNQLYKQKYSEMYDGLIFVKKISIPDYKFEK